MDGKRDFPWILVITPVLICLLLTLNGCNAPVVVPKWEYQIVTLAGISNPDANQFYEIGASLASLGQQGWECTTQISLTDRFLCKRPVSVLAGN